ncbi:MAG: ArsR/SmtB family transcription factor [Panacagrimonas sp.]
MDEYKSSRLDAVFGAVADPTRRAILARLALADARVTELAADFPISLNSTSKHIRVLEGARLVHRTVVGRDHVLSLNAAQLADAAKWIDHYRQFWEDRLAALDRYVTRKRPRATTKRKRQ